MKFLCAGDIHYRATTPRGRLDNYPETLLSKMDQIFTLANDHNAKGVILPGDVFDSPTPPMWLLGRVGKQTLKAMDIYVVLGQHDQRYHHTARENTPLGVLEAMELAHVLGAEPMAYIGENYGHFGTQTIHLYGASWNSEIPKPIDETKTNILVMHRMILGNEKLWKQQQDYMWSRHVLRRNKFDLIVTGDNHHFFTDTIPGRGGPRHLVNCGSLMRTNVDQVNHKPSVVLYDTVDRTIETIPLKVAPAKTVLSTEIAAQAKERNMELESFVSQIGDTAIAPELDFLSNVNKLAQNKGVPETVQAKVNEIINMSE